MKKLIAGSIISVICLCNCVGAEIEEYRDESIGVVCKRILTNKADFSAVVSCLDPDSKEYYTNLLEETFTKIDSPAATSEDFEIISSNLSMLSSVVPLKEQKMLEDVFLNFLIRSALLGNIDAMYDLLGISFNPSKERLLEIFEIYPEGGDSVEFNKLKTDLEEELNGNPDSGAFKRVILKIRSHSESASRRNSDVSEQLSAAQLKRSFSDSELLKKK